MDDIYLTLAEAIKEKKQVCLCILVQTNGSVPLPAGGKMIVFADGRTVGSVGGGGLESRVIDEAQLALKTGKNKLIDYSMAANVEGSVGVCGGSAKVYIEPQLGNPTLLILGAGHVGLAVAKLASKMDFRVILSDDRKDAVDPAALPPHVELIVGEISDLPEMVKITPNTFIIGVSRDAAIDIKGFPALLRSDFSYFGAIGSKNRWAHTRAGLLEAGVPAEKVNRIKSPIGLDIHAVTPDEIAISILAEIIQHMNKK